MSTPFDDCLRAIGSSDRRRLLAELTVREPGAVVSVGGPGSIPGSERRRKRLTMVHVHLPLLEELDLVERRDDGFQVCRGERFEDVQPLVELLIANEEQWPDALTKRASPTD